MGAAGVILICKTMAKSKGVLPSAWGCGVMNVLCIHATIRYSFKNITGMAFAIKPAP